MGTHYEQINTIILSVLFFIIEARCDKKKYKAKIVPKGKYKENN